MKKGSDTSTYGTSGSQRGYRKNTAMATELRDIESHRVCLAKYSGFFRPKSYKILTVLALNARP